MEAPPFGTLQSVVTCRLCSTFANFHVRLVSIQVLVATWLSAGPRRTGIGALFSTCVHFQLCVEWIPVLVTTTPSDMLLHMGTYSLLSTCAHFQ